MKKNILPMGILSLAFATSIQAEPTVSICKWKNDNHAAFSLILDDFGDSKYTKEILTAGDMAHKRGLRIASAAVVQRMVSAGAVRWNDMNTFISQGHEIVNHSWNHDNPKSSAWNDLRDMSATKDSLEAHLADSVWQDSITFFCFPEDAGTVAQLDSLKAYGYIGARFRTGNESDRVNSGNQDFNSFRSNFYGYISKEYGDSVLAVAPGSTYTDWWLTYPDKPYLKYKSPIEKLELRHLDKTVELGGWGLMEMHSIAPSQIYPKDIPWWSPMSYEKFGILLDRFAELKNADSLWMSVPSEVASYITLKNNCIISVRDSSITFDYRAVDKRYLTELTLKINSDTFTYRQNGKNIPSVKKGSNTALITVNPANGPVQFSSGAVSVPNISNKSAGIIAVGNANGSVQLTIPSGEYQIQLVNVRGQVVATEHLNITSTIESVFLGRSFSPGIYILSVNSGVIQTTQKITIN